MKEAFITKRFNVSSRAVIEAANLAIDLNRAAGVSTTLRQLYYSLVGAGILENKTTEYKRVCNIISDARLAGLVDWDSIEDRMRLVRSIPHYTSIGDFLRQQTTNYAEDLWANQGNYCEVWIEKESLVGVIEHTCTTYRVPFFASKGYASQIGLYEAGKRVGVKMAEGKKAVIFYLGDYDQAGVSMAKDLEERMTLFTAKSGTVDFRRIALTADQIAYYNMPPDPSDATKQTWEIEAFPSSELIRLLVSSISNEIDPKLYLELAANELASREHLRATVGMMNYR